METFSKASVPPLSKVSRNIVEPFSLSNFIKALFRSKLPQIKYPSLNSIALLPKLCSPIFISLLQRSCPLALILTIKIFELKFE